MRPYAAHETQIREHAGHDTELWPDAWYCHDCDLRISMEDNE